MMMRYMKAFQPCKIVTHEIFLSVMWVCCFPYLREVSDAASSVWLFMYTIQLNSYTRSVVVVTFDVLPTKYSRISCSCYMGNMSSMNG